MFTWARSATATADVNTSTPGTGSWSQLTVNFTTGISSTSVSIYVHGWYGQPTYVADDVSLDGHGGPPPSMTPTTAERSAVIHSAAEHEHPAVQRFPAHACAHHLLAELCFAAQRCAGQLQHHRGVLCRHRREQACRRDLHLRLGPVQPAPRVHRRPVRGRHQDTPRQWPAGDISAGGQNGTISVGDSASSGAGVIGCLIGHSPSPRRCGIRSDRASASAGRIPRPGPASWWTRGRRPAGTSWRTSSIHS